METPCEANPVKNYENLRVVESEELKNEVTKNSRC
ncbi:hypothetical protein JOD41_000518 [Peptoniphilus gorbachii]|uniref:Uncharacterized protein n=1 Tax=Peptoniphilus gorbachii TaxID=411567 RepID=A0ABS2MIF7_9FIRM|nr:hypothetical protein [Peptoniphilus gorbachii]